MLRVCVCVYASVSTRHSVSRVSVYVCGSFKIEDASELVSNARCSSRIVRRTRLTFLNYDYELSVRSRACVFPCYRLLWKQSMTLLS